MSHLEFPLGEFPDVPVHTPTSPAGPQPPNSAPAYAPPSDSIDTGNGRQTLAHELTHQILQSRGSFDGFGGKVSPFADEDGGEADDGPIEAR